MRHVTVKMAGTNVVQSVVMSLSASDTITVDATAITKEDSQANADISVLSAPHWQNLAGGIQPFEGFGLIVSNRTVGNKRANREF